MQGKPAVGAERTVSASRGQGNQGRVNAPEDWAWADLVQFVQSPEQATVTHSYYFSLPKNRPKGAPAGLVTQSSLKTDDEFVLFGVCKNGKRDDANLLSRSAITLDYDQPDALGLMRRLRLESLSIPFAYVWHTTRSHDVNIVAERVQPKIRIIVPLARDVTATEYRLLVKAVAALFPATLDEAALKPSQMMYCPIHNKGAPYRCGAFAGQGYLEPDSVLAFIPTDEGTEQPKTRAVARVPGVEYDVFIHGDGKMRLSLEEAADLLEYQPSDIDYDDWVEIGQALHLQFDGAEEALRMWDRWSAEAEDRYEEGLCEKKWRSFHTAAELGRQPVSLRKLIKEIAQNKKYAKHDRVKYWAEQMQQTDDRAVLFDDLPERIRRDALLDAFGREELAQRLGTRLKTVTGSKPKIDQLRELLKPDITDADDDHEVPGWVKDWVYVTVGDTFFSLTEHTEVTRSGFNAKYDREIPKDDQGNPRYRAADGALQRWGMHVVTRIDYNPLAGPRYTVDGVPGEFVNRYDPESVPVERKVDEAARDTILAHIALLLPDTREQQLLLNWLAYVCQNPGIKVRWAPYLCGPEGDGKSFFCNLLQTTMGLSNVNILAGSQFENSSFTDWAVGQSVLFIEEMKLHGHNKHDAANRLKPYITNPMIPVHPKGRPAYTALNTTQYFITSNHMDGVPITSGDRRYMFLRTAFNVETLIRFRIENPDYYKNLFGALETSPGGLRRWLVRYDDWHPDFDPNGNAPITAAREQVIEMSKNDIDSVCEDVIREKPPGVLDSWVASASFVAAVQRKLGDDFYGGKQKLAKLAAQWLAANHWKYVGEEKHRIGPQKIESRFWTKYNSVSKDWWRHVSRDMEASFDQPGASEFDDPKDEKWKKLFS
jgi:hypothetical protein